MFALVLLPHICLWTIAIAQSPSPIPSKFDCGRRNYHYGGKGKGTGSSTTTHTSGCSSISPTVIIASSSHAPSPAWMRTISPSSKVAATVYPSTLANPSFPAPQYGSVTEPTFVPSNAAPFDGNSMSTSPSVRKTLGPSITQTSQLPSVTSETTLHPQYGSVTEPTFVPSNAATFDVNSMSTSPSVRKTLGPSITQTSQLPSVTSETTLQASQFPSVMSKTSLTLSPDLSSRSSTQPTLDDSEKYALSSPPTINRNETSSPSSIVETFLERGKGCYNSSIDAFGQISDHDIRVQFLYEMEYKESDAYTFESILNSLELAISHSLMEALFVKPCANNSSRWFRLKNESVVGVSDQPNDRVLVDTCKMIYGAVNACALIEGRLHVYISVAANNSMNIESEVQTVIEKGMQSGSLAESHNGIVKLQYANEFDEDTNSQFTGEDAKQDDTSPGESIVPTYVWFLMASGAFVLVGLAGTLLRQANEGLEYGEVDDDNFLSP